MKAYVTNVAGSIVMIPLARQAVHRALRLRVSSIRGPGRRFCAVLWHRGPGRCASALTRCDAPPVLEVLTGGEAFPVCARHGTNLVRRPRRWISTKVVDS